MTFCVIGSQPASQPASQPTSLPAIIGQPTSHVTRYKPVRLWVVQIFGGRRTGSQTTLGPSPGSQHSHWFPLGSDLPDQSQASDTNELCSLLYAFGTTFRAHLQLLYLCCLITYSCMHCREMLYGLCSLLTNLHTSFHHQSDV